jgi:hypothetical protein
MQYAGLGIYANAALISLPIAIGPVALLFPTTGSKVLFGALLLTYVILVLDLVTSTSGTSLPFWTDVALLICVMAAALYFWAEYVWKNTTETKPMKPRSQVAMD